MVKIRPRWSEATKEVIEILLKKGINFENLKGLEMFARDGSWHSIEFNKILSLEAWEIDKKFEKELKKNLPNSKIQIIDSIFTLTKYDDLPKFDVIIIDNPMNTYGPIIDKYGIYCEHFTFLDKIGKIMDKNAIVIFNINRAPFDYYKFPEWKKRRDQFYGHKKTNLMSIDYLLDFYKKKFFMNGLITEFCFNVIRVFNEDVDMIHYFVFSLKKIENKKI